MKAMLITIVIGTLGMVPKSFKEDWERRKSDEESKPFFNIGQNTEESPGDLNRFAVNQTPVKHHQLMLVGKTQGVK